jgi:hypothetical protein
LDPDLAVAFYFTRDLTEDLAKDTFGLAAIELTRKK